MPVSQNLFQFARLDDPAKCRIEILGKRLVFPDRIQYSFTEPNTYMGLTYGAEWSTTLTPGSWTPLTDLDSSPNHLFKLSTTGLDKVFVRLKVTPR